MYKYFVSYNVNNERESFFGNAEVIRTQRITDIKDVMLIARDIEHECSFKKDSISIISFQRFDD